MPTYNAALPTVSDRDRIPVYRASLRAIRVIDPGVFITFRTSIEIVNETVERAANDPTVQIAAQAITDPLVARLRTNWREGVIPEFDPGLIHDIIVVAAAEARVEKDSGWTNLEYLHPSIHCSLAMLFAVGDPSNPGASVFLDAAFNAARGSSSDGSTFAEG